MIPLMVLALLGAEAKPSPLHLFDGETTFGWQIEGEAKVEKGELILGGTKATRADIAARFSSGQLLVKGKYDEGVEVEVNEKACAPLETINVPVLAGKSLFHVTVPAGKRAILRSARFELSSMDSLFDGKTLAGWKPFKGDPRREKSTFAAKDGLLTMKSGPGDLATEKLFNDFVLQIDCQTSGKHLNSGVFFRAIPGEYQNGYECQIHNDFTLSPAKNYLVDVFDPKENKKTGTREVLSTAKDFGTGAIYRRIPARKAVAKDGEWFTLTVVARGRHIATWVDGVQQVDWTDHRLADNNPRKGYREKAGAISLQGHDPTTDLSFRNIRIATIPRRP